MGRRVEGRAQGLDRVTRWYIGRDACLVPVVTPSSPWDLVGYTIDSGPDSETVWEWVP